MPDLQTAFPAWLAHLKRVAALRRWRYLVLLAGDRHWARALCALSAQLQDDDTVWAGEDWPAGRRVIGFRRANSLLGSETGNVVFDAWSGFHPNAFAALAGTIRAGGVLLLLSPALDQWQHFDDPDYQRMGVPGEPGDTRRHFLRHLARRLNDDDRVIRVSPGIALPELTASVDAAQLAWPPRSDDYLTEEQAQAVTAMERVAHGHRNRPLVLCADRGRGKTAALGIACAHLLRVQVSPIVVTAPLPRNVEALFERAAALLPGAQRRARSLTWHSGSIRYLAPDQLLTSVPEARLLMVDEAAAIPAALLSGMLDHYHRVIFTTTVHGYEGTGRGFALRFQAELSRRMPQWRYLTLFAPVRWAPGDPLEGALNRLLLLQADAVSDASFAASDGDVEHRLSFLERERLVSEPALLSQLFGLLMMAHYRTTPDDLRLLLDGPTMRIAALYQGGHLAGVVLLAEEGRLAPDLIDALQRGLRRPRGHLLPQTVLAQTGNASLLTLLGWRIVRIAVHPALQRRGRGLLMLRWLAEQAGARGIDYLGSSFGATPGLIAFWHRADYLPLSLGSRRDATSGAHALVVMQALTPACHDIAQAERERLAESLPIALVDSLRELEADVVAALLRTLPLRYPLEARDRDDVQAFVAGARTYQACSLALWKAALALLADGTVKRGLDASAVLLLVSKLLQRDSWQRASERTGLSGKAQLVAALRGLFAEWTATP